MAKDLMSLAKGGKKATQQTTKKAPAVKKTAEPKLSADQERDLKAKQKVAELLEDIPLTPEKKEETIIVETAPTPNTGVEWLEEQVTLLSEQAEGLRSELAQYKEGYTKLYEENQRLKAGGVNSNDPTVQAKVVELFNELQGHYISMGFNQMGEPNFRIVCPAFLNRLIMFFPFLQNYKRY